MSTSLFKVSFSYVLTKYIVVIINFIRSLVVASALGPKNLGEYAFIVILLEYLNYSNLGIFHAMNKEVSINLGKDERKLYINNIINSSFSFQIINSFLVGIFFLIFYYLQEIGLFENNAFDSKYLIYIFILGVLYQLKSFAFVYLRFFDRFSGIVRIELFSSVITFIGIYFFVERFLIDAILVSSIIGNIIVIFPTILRINNLKFFIDFNLLKQLLLLAVQLLFFNFLVLLTTSIDRLMISQFFSSDKSALGIFHFGYLLSFGVMTAFNSVIFLLVPKALRQFNSKNQDIDLMIRQTKLVENILVIIAVIAICIFPIFIEIFMPQYLKSIIIMQLLLLAYSINGLAFLPGTFMVANNFQLKLFPAFIVALASAVILNYTSFLLGYGLNGIAMATIMTFVIYTFGLFLSYFKLQNKALLKSIFKTFWKLWIFSLLSIILIFERSNFLWFIFLYALLYGRDIILITKTYFPLLSSKFR